MAFSRSVASFGDLDLDYLTSIHELEASDSHLLSFTGAESALTSSPESSAKRGDVLARTRSEAALPSSGSAKRGNPLAALGPDAGLQCALDFLASDSLRCAHVPPMCPHPLPQTSSLPPQFSACPPVKCAGARFRRHMCTGRAISTLLA